MPAVKTAVTIESLQKQVASLNRTVQQLTKRLNHVERNQWAIDVDEHGNYSMSPAMEAEMDRRFDELEADPSLGIPHEEVVAHFRKLAGKS